MGTGPKGKLVRDFRHLNCEITKKYNTLTVAVWFGLRKDLACIRTVCSHITNMCTGVTKGFRYKMRFVYAHFPINAAITKENKCIEIRNFVGDKVVRTVNMLPGVEIIRSEKVKDQVELSGMIWSPSRSRPPPSITRPW